MRVDICDHCGKYGDAIQLNAVEVLIASPSGEINPAYRSTVKELCKDCIDALRFEINQCVNGDYRLSVRVDKVRGA